MKPFALDFAVYSPENTPVLACILAWLYTCLFYNESDSLLYKPFPSKNSPTGHPIKVAMIGALSRRKFAALFSKKEFASISKENLKVA